MKVFKGRFRGPLLLGVGMLLFMTALLYIGFGSKDIRRSTEKANKKISYVLVNQDVGAEFNGKQYDLGEDFVHLINQDSQHQWQTASLSVAEAGYKQGSYDAEIILPQDFSKRLLSLEEIDPEQASISYKVKPGENKVTNQAAQQKILEILNTFNQKIVQMYFSSVLSNLASAQQNVSSIVTDQTDNQNSLVEDIQIPFQDLPGSYTSIIDEASSLKEANSSWEQQQNDFSKDTQSLLTETADSIKKQSEDLDTYKKLQETISQVNKTDAQNAVDNQQQADLADYKQLYDNLNRSVLDQFGLFDSQDPQGIETGTLAMLKGNGELFSVTQNKRISEIKQEINALSQQVQQLSNIQKTIAKKYFASEDESPETVTDDDVKTAILRLMEPDVGNRSNMLPLYFDTIDRSVESLSVTDLTNMLTALKTNQVISSNQLNEYEAAIEIVKKYASDEKISFGNQRSFSYVSTKNDDPLTSKTFKQTVTYQIDLNQKNIIKLQPSVSTEGGQLSIDNSDTIKSEIQQQLGTKLVDLGYTGTPTVDVSTHSITIDCSNLQFSVPDNSNATNSDPQDSTASSKTASPMTTVSPQEVGLTIKDIELNWQFSEAEKNALFSQLDYQWFVNDQADLQSSGTLSTFVDHGKKNASLSADFSPLMQQLDSLEQVVGQIILVFGDPSENDLGIEHFNDEWQQYPDRTLKEQAAASSIYLSYDNITPDEKKELISSSLVKLFREQGESLYQSVSEQKAELLGTIGKNQSTDGTDIAGENLTNTLDQMISPDYVNKEAENLQVWYEQAQKMIADSYGRWKENPAIQLKIEQYSETATQDDEKNQTIYFDDSTGSQLYDQFTAMAESSIAQAKSTKEQAAEIKSLDKEFDGLSSGTSDVKNDAQGILNNLDQFIEKNGGEVKGNQAYDDKFSKVLNNTHTGGADNAVVFNFLSNPLRSTGDNGTVAESSVIPYFMTIISFLIVLVISHRLRYLNMQRKMTEAAQLLQPSRIWLNTPASLRLFSISVVTAAVFSWITHSLVKTSVPLVWEGYTFLTVTSGILLFTALWRWLSKAAFYVFGLIAGVYLLMSPTIGMSIVRNSFVGWLFRLSPLQNLENGYSALVRGIGIGWQTLVFLMVLVVIGMLLNLTVKNKLKEGSTNEE